MFNYCGNKRVADIIFALFTVIWIPTRHALFAIPFLSLTFEAPYLITVRPTYAGCRPTAIAPRAVFVVVAVQRGCGGGVTVLGDSVVYRPCVCAHTPVRVCGGLLRVRRASRHLTTQVWGTTSTRCGVSSFTTWGLCCFRCDRQLGGPWFPLRSPAVLPLTPEHRHTHLRMHTHEPRGV
jgi:hypothetical protein